MEYKETKANKAISFWHFIQEHTVEIPIIQRDYAQGRLGKEYLRKTFLESLKQALDEGREALKLDFVYGSKENGKLQPLDGQQRLTTLWLLHWYVALRAGKLDEVVKGQERICDVLRNFTYETRISSREFCGCLRNADNFKTFDGKDIVGFITSQTWFYSVWKQDPTIQSMLRMLGGTKINNKAGEDITDGMEELFDGTDKFDEYWDSLSSDCSPIIFYYLHLNDFGLSDDLYVKMNARGKQLTSFENFKADLLGYIASQAEEDKKWEKFLDPENGIAIKLDTTWTDLFWQESRDNKIDEIYFAFLNRFFLNWIMLRNSSEKNIETDKTYKYLYGDDSNDSKLIYGSFDIYKFEELYDVLNHLTETLNHFAASCCENSKISGNKFDKIKAASLPSWKENDDFYFIPQYKEYTITTLKRDQRVVFHAVCKYFEIGTYDESSFKRWMRVVWNIVENSNATLIGCLKLIDEIGEHCHDVYAFLADNNTIVKSDAAKEQLAEETEKAKQILKKDYSGNIEEFNGKTWEDVISEAEKYAFFKGAIRFLFLNNSGEWDWSDFDTKWKNLKKSVTSTKEDRNVIYHMISFFNDEDIKTIFTGYDLSNDDNNLRGIFVKYASKMHNFLMNENSSQELSLLQTDLRALCEKYPTFWIHKQWMCGMDVLSNYAYRSGDYSSRSFFIGTSFIRERLAFLKEIDGVTINGQQSNWLDNESMPPKGLHISFEYKKGNTSYSFKWQSWNWIDMYDGDKRLCKDENLKSYKLTINGSDIKDEVDLIEKMNQCIDRYMNAKRNADQPN